MTAATRVHLPYGELDGRAVPHGVLFGGVPYAAAPVGDLRYQAPAPPPGWDGVRDATAVGVPAPQPRRQLAGIDTEALLGHAAEVPSLTVDVWTPDPTAGRDGPGLPVLVWLHGGAFVAGSPGQPLYAGGPWMRDGVVLVGVTYRLGVEGFLPFAGGVTNAALRDQLAALTWVRDHIAAFGGDPGRVTLAGQSAGAFCASWLLGSPYAAGLFGRAIVMSGGCDLTWSPAQADLAATHVAGLLGVEPTAAAMSAVPIADVLAAQAAVLPGTIDFASTGEPDPGGGIAWLGGVRDGDVIAADPLAAIEAAASVDLLCGDAAEEGRLYVAGQPGFDPDDASDPLLARAAAVTEQVFHGPVRRLRERHAEVAAAGDSGGTTYGYRFAWPSTAVGGRLGAAHAVDLPYVFDALDAEGAGGADDRLLGVAGGDADLATRMHRSFVGFVTDGDPGHPAHPHLEVWDSRG